MTALLFISNTRYSGYWQVANKIFKNPRRDSLSGESFVACCSVHAVTRCYIFWATNMVPVSWAAKVLHQVGRVSVNSGAENAFFLFSFRVILGSRPLRTDPFNPDFAFLTVRSQGFLVFALLFFLCVGEWSGFKSERSTARSCPVRLGSTHVVFLI